MVLCILPHKGRVLCVRLKSYWSWQCSVIMTTKRLAAAESVKDKFKFATKIVTKHAIQYWISCRINIAQCYSEDVKNPSLVKPSAGECVVDQEDLVWRVAEEVNGHTGHQHFNNALSGSDCFVQHTRPSAIWTSCRTYSTTVPM